MGMTQTEIFRLLLDERGLVHSDLSDLVTVVPHCEGSAVVEEDEGKLTVSLVREMTPAQAILALMGPSLLTWRDAEPSPVPDAVIVGGRGYVREDIARTNWHRWFGNPVRAAESVSQVVDHVEAICKGEHSHGDFIDAMDEGAPYALCHTDTLAGWLERGTAE